MEKNKKKRLKLLQATSQYKQRYKLYKAKHNWVIAEISIVTLGLFTIFAPSTTHAATENDETIHVSDNNLQTNNQALQQSQVALHTDRATQKSVSAAKPAVSSAANYNDVSTIKDNVNNHNDEAQNDNNSMAAAPNSQDSSSQTSQLSEAEEPAQSAVTESNASSTGGSNYSNQAGSEQPVQSATSQNSDADFAVSSASAAATDSAENSSATETSNSLAAQSVPTKATRSNTQRSQAAADVPSGTLGTVKWSISQKVLTLSAGTLPDEVAINNESPWAAYADQIVKVIFNGPVIAGRSLESFFHNLSELQIIENLNQLNTSKVTNMKRLFAEDAKLKKSNVSQFDTSNVTDMQSMFYNCEKLQAVDVSGFDTANVTNMKTMFYDCNNLTKLDVSNFSTANVTDMSYMFYDCSSVKELDVSGFDTANVANMKSMFNQCSNLTRLNVSNFSTANVTDMSYMFYDCNNLTKLDVSNFSTASVTDMSYMFYDCSSIKELDLSGFDTANVTNMKSMFYSCNNLTKLDVSNFNTANVTDMTSIFYHCTDLWQLTLGPNTRTTDNLGSEPRVPGKNTPIPGSDGFYVADGSRFWQAVGNGSVHSPQGDTYQTIKDLFTLQLKAPTTFVWAQLNAARIQYIDEDGNDLSSHDYSLGGNIGDVIVDETTPWDYEAEHYLLDEEKSNLLQDGDTITGNQQTFKIYLKHKMRTNDNVTTTNTISYRDQNGREIAKGSEPQTIIWSSVTDLVTGKTTYRVIDGGSSVESPEVSGYHPDQETVNFDTADRITRPSNQKIVVTYQPNTDTTALITYKDSDGNDVVIGSPITVTGTTDASITYTVVIPDGYMLDSERNVQNGVIIEGNKLTFTVLATDEDNQIIYLKHQVQTLADDVRTIVRKINVTNPKTGQVTTKQQAKFSRSASRDLVTGEIIYGAWSANQQWAQYDVPAIMGYTPSQESVAEVMVTPDMKDQVINITYTANEQTLTINYVDRNGKLVDSQKFVGKTDSKIALQFAIPENWEVIDGTKLPEEYVFTAADNQSLTIKIQHQIEQLADDDKTITRTIKITDPQTGKVTTEEQNAKFTRSASRDLVTGEIVYGAWSANQQWAQYDVPAIMGYTPSQESVAAVTVTPDMKDQQVNIDYTANEQTLTIKYVDAAGKTISRQQVTGKSGEEVALTAQVPQNWQLANATAFPESYTFTAENNQTLTFEIQHQIEQLADDDKTITRTINVTNPKTGEVTTEKQNAKFTRSASRDLVTGEIIYGVWSANQQWDKYDVPSIAGYTPNQERVAAVSVTPDMKDQQVNIDYTANEQVLTINYVDQNGEQIGAPQLVTGKTDKVVVLQFEIPDNWEVSDTAALPKDYTFTAENNQTLTFEIQHQIEQATKTKTITRTIRITYPKLINQTLRQLRYASNKRATVTPQVIRQFVIFSRLVFKDLVTGDVSYGEWTTNNNIWPTYVLPTIPGYKPNIAVIPAVIVTPQMTDADDKDIDITYVAETDTPATITYIDSDGHDAQVGSMKLIGTTDQTFTYTLVLPKGYQLDVKRNAAHQLHINDSGQLTLTIKADNSDDQTVYLLHQLRQYTPEAPGQTTTTNRNALQKRVVQVIHYGTPISQSTQAVTVATFYRTVTVDMVTGETIYSAWTTATDGDSEKGQSSVSVDALTAEQYNVPAGYVLDKIVTTRSDDANYHSGNSIVMVGQNGTEDVLITRQLTYKADVNNRVVIIYVDGDNRNQVVKKVVARQHYLVAVPSGYIIDTAKNAFYNGETIDLSLVNGKLVIYLRQQATQLPSATEPNVDQSTQNDNVVKLKNQSNIKPNTSVDKTMLQRPVKAGSVVAQSQHIDQELPHNSAQKLPQNSEKSADELNKLGVISLLLSLLGWVKIGKKRRHEKF